MKLNLFWENVHCRNYYTTDSMSLNYMYHYMFMIAVLEMIVENNKISCSIRVRTVLKSPSILREVLEKSLNFLELWMYWPRKSFLMLFGCPRQNINHSSENFKVIYIKCSMFYVYCTSRTVYNFIVFSGSVEVFILHCLSLSLFFSSTYQWSNVSS